MTEVELVKMSPKGQLVVPKDIREQEAFSPSDRFMSFPVKNGVLFKKVKLPNVQAEFNSLAKEIQQQFKKQKVSAKDVDEAVKWARKKSS
jgi:bifunctional DNA-binding transcriptional regulator/antitoxin component of YhaV-PrlF toxin-antitoxin module